MDRNSLNRGFTLVELMAAMAVLGVVAALASPPLGALLEAHAATAARHRLTTALALGRLAAVKLGHPVTVCPSRDGQHCRTDGVWESGWIVYADPDRQAAPVKADRVLEHDGRVGHGLSIRSTPGRSRVRFSPDGWSAGHNLTIEVCTPRKGATHRIIVNNAGRPRTERLPRGQDCAP
ncbi:GspH/FimT family pseudopilin [Marilutibacter spongiae]|uniref:Type II secretion system protein H n=1 Tax=Marilutibacter spongiae TaxID=2025720 RepID=A0A7W3Y5D6_9GAMM|nr:GspH/FimT family pseudopilin [Lysobacter spongiae]MBB1060358.1 GspH/FimT family pseudopilin [Lysobacter spongiae]